jgi:hypothetical protein
MADSGDGISEDTGGSPTIETFGAVRVMREPQVVAGGGDGPSPGGAEAGAASTSVVVQTPDVEVIGPEMALAQVEEKPRVFPTVSPTIGSTGTLAFGSTSSCVGLVLDV